MKQVIVSGVNIQLQADLIDMQPWARQNDGFKYILLAIDCFSRFAYSQPLTTKQGQIVANALEKILDEAESRIDRTVKKLQTDQGLEFYNKHVRDLLKARHIQLFSTKSPTKAQMVERLIRTLRSRQERYNTHKGERRWVESFPKFVASYNKMKHSSLNNLSPAQINLSNEKQTWLHLYGDTFFKTASKQNLSLKIGDPVRLSKRKMLFEKSYYQNYTDEIFFISHISKSTRPTAYRLTDIDGQPIEGVFYKEELSPIRFDEKDNLFAVEQVLKQEIRKGKKYLLVKWRGFSNASNEWVRADQFKSIQNAT